MEGKEEGRKSQCRKLSYVRSFQGGGDLIMVAQDERKRRRSFMEGKRYCIST